jgi:hypothetical protein
MSNVSSPDDASQHGLIEYQKSLRDAAALYLSRGYAVIPLSAVIVKPETGKKEVFPLIKWKTDGPCRLIEDWPASGKVGGIAIDTGVSGVHVLDLDDYKPNAETDFTTPEGAWMQNSGQGGRHVMTRNVSGARNTAGAGGVDSRGEGGLLIVAPTLVRLRDGGMGRYTTVRPLEELPRPADLPDTPDEYLYAVGAKTEGAAADAGDPREGLSPGEPLLVTREYAHGLVGTMRARVRATRQGDGLHNVILPWAANEARYALANGEQLDGLSESIHDSLAGHPDWGVPAWNVASSLDAVRWGVARAVEGPWRFDARDVPRAVWMFANAATFADELADRIGQGELSDIYIRGGRLVQGTGEGAPVDLDASGLQGLIRSRYFVSKIDAKGVPSHAIPPKDACSVVVSQPRVLRGVREHRGVRSLPLVRADGSILYSVGYDMITGIEILPHTVAPIPDVVSDEDVKQAVKAIEAPIALFPWAGQHDRANYLGLMLTPLLRELAPPPYKLGAFDAPVQGSGKGYLASVLVALFGGDMESPPETTTGKLDLVELSKRVDSFLLESDNPIYVFDNVVGRFGGSKLATLLTAGVLSPRRLGTSNVSVVENDRLWLATSNNMALTDDMLRRTVWVRIDPHVERPENRRFPFVPSRVATENRDEIIGALLTLIRAWVQAGRPTPEGGSDTYERWRGVVRGILAVAGISGPLGTFDSAESAPVERSEDATDLEIFLAAIYAGHKGEPWTVPELFGTMTPMELANAVPGELSRAFGDWQVQRTTAKLFYRAAGAYLGYRKGRVVGGYSVVRHGENRYHQSRWSVELAE